MVRLTFKQFIEEELVKGPLEIKLSQKQLDALKDDEREEAIKQEAQSKASYPGSDDNLETAAKKIEQQDFDMKNIEKAVASGGTAKEEAARKAKSKRDNTHFGPSQFYVVPARLKTPSATIQEK